VEPSLAKIKEIIRRPDNADHMMRIKPISGKVQIRTHDQILAESENACWIMEIGKDVYDPVVYVPLADVTKARHKTDKRTHCPLKGDCCYYSFEIDGCDNLAWQYDEPMVFARQLEDMAGFDASRVVVMLLP